MKRNFSHSQQQKFLNKMALTPQMRQSINILGMPIKDLNEHINSLLANNPCLKKLADDHKNRDRYQASGEITKSDTPEDYDIRSAQETKPHQALLSQLRMHGLTGDEMKIAEYLIYEMDGNGYIIIDSEEAGADLGVSAEDIEAIVEVIQKMEPAGIGARDLAECLQLQLKRMGKEASIEYEIASSYLTELAKNDVAAIAKSLKIDEKMAIDAMAHVKNLNPRPGSTMLSSESAKIIPDLVATVNRKKVRLEVNRTYMPRLEVYNPYLNNLDIIADPEARQFLAENTNLAKGLISNLKRREETLCRVAQYIMEHQREAILTDNSNLRTLTIDSVAKALDFHQSTISRSVSNKYVQINDKVIPLKNLLTHGVENKNGDIVSKASVKKRIETLVNAEDRKAPLTDMSIQEALEREGFVIKRRTVAKYREELKILPVHLRKKAS